MVNDRLQVPYWKSGHSYVISQYIFCRARLKAVAVHY